MSGGEPVADGALPFVAKVSFGDAQTCTGALVGTRWVITHKDCFASAGAPVTAGAPAAPTTVLLGRADLTKVTGHRLMVQSVIPHPDRDIALAELSAPVKNITPVTLGGSAPLVGESLKIAGFGRTATEWVPDRMHAATFTVQSAAETSFEVAGGTLCKGDAGAPAFRETSAGVELVGIGSTSEQKGCLGQPEGAEGGVATRADDLAGWVRSTIAVQPSSLREPVTGEFNRDGRQDMIAADAAGIQWLYPGTDTPGLWGDRVRIGNNWAGYRDFAIGKVNRDEFDDLITIESATGKLWLYPGTAAGGAFGVRSEYGTGWTSFRDVTIGKVNRDAYDDLLVVRDTDSKLFLYKGNAGGVRFDAGVEYGSGWQCCQQLTLGKFNQDDYDDLITVDKATGKLRIYAGTAAGTQFLPGVDPGAGTGWTAYSYLTRGKLDGTGLDGLLAVDTATGQSWVHPRTDTAGWGARVAPVGKVWDPQPYELSKIAVGEMNRDAYPDLIGADSAGVLWMHPGTAARTFGPRVKIGNGGWNGQRELVVARANRDNYDDLITIDTATAAQQWLYPGTAAGSTFGTRVQIGSGWTNLRDVAIGRVDHDGYDDLLTVSNADNRLLLYKGTAAGGNFAAGVGFGTGWQCCSQVTLGSFNQDDYDDLLTVDNATGKLRLYSSNEGGVQFDPAVDPGAGAIWAGRTELVAIQLAPGEHDSLLAKDPSGAMFLSPTTPKGNVDWADPIRFGPRD